jgi:hypothetical protein
MSGDAVESRAADATAGPAAEGTASRRGLRLGWFALLAAGLLLRAWGLDFGLDRGDASRAIFLHQQDEADMVQAELRGLLRGVPDPGRFMLWGSANFWLFGLADLLVLWPAARLGGADWDGALARLEANPSDLHLVHRAVSLLASLGLILVLGRILRREAGDLAALAGAALLATGYLAVREAHFGTLDTCIALWILLAVDRCLLLAREPTLRQHVLAGLFVGLAAATKYSGVVASLPVAAAHVLAAWRRPAGARPSPFFLVAAAAAAGATFLVLSPHVVLDHAAWRAAVAEVQGTIAMRWQPGVVLEQARQHAVGTLWIGAGEPVLLLAVAGAVLAFRRGGPARLLALAPLLLLPMFFLVLSRNVRYGVAHVALLAGLAGLASAALAARLAPRRPLALLGALVLLAAAPSLLRGVSFDRLLTGRDTRLDVQAHLARAGARTGDLVMFGLYGLRGPPFAPGAGESLNWLGAVHRTGLLTRDEALALRPRFVLRDGSAAGLEAYGWSLFEPVIRAEYHEVLHVDARPDPTAVELPEPEAGTPGFFVPWRNPWAMERPGPPLTLYERIAP